MSEYLDAQQPAENEEVQNKYLVFTIDENYALELSKIIEIMEYKPITRVPETPAYIAGVMNRQGLVVPVIDMRKRFHKPDAEASTRRCIVVVRFEGMHLGLVVDNVTDLVEIPPDKRSVPPQVGKDYSHVFIKEIGVLNGQMMMIVDADKLVNHQDLHLLDEMAEDAPEKQPKNKEKGVGKNA